MVLLQTNQPEPVKESDLTQIHGSSIFLLHLLVIGIDFKGSKISPVHQRIVTTCLCNVAVLQVFLFRVCSLIEKL